VNRLFIIRSLLILLLVGGRRFGLHCGNIGSGRPSFVFKTLQNCIAPLSVGFPAIAWTRAAVDTDVDIDVYTLVLAFSTIAMMAQHIRMQHALSEIHSVGIF
jgi:hypothetical protein